MNQLREKLRHSPILARVLPFGIFLLLTFGQGKFFASSEYWLYFFKTLIGLALLWFMRPAVTEMRWALSWEAVAIGVAVFIVWVALDSFYPHLEELFRYLHLTEKSPETPTTWNPHTDRKSVV